MTAREVESNPGGSALAPRHPRIVMHDRAIALLIVLLSLAVDAYFFQGIGWNQMVHFATIRSLAERGTADITPFAWATGDTMRVGTHLYSNKPPGLALVGLAPYFLLFHLEKCFGMDPAQQWLPNLYAMTVLLSAVPAAALNGLLYFAFRREGASTRLAMLLAGGFAFGSLSLPYSGALMAHMLCALLAFAAWYLLTAPQIKRSTVLLAGALLGLANLCDLLTLVVTVSLAALVVTRRPRWLIRFALGPCAAAVVLLLYNHFAVGSATRSGPFESSVVHEPGLLFGQFGWPDVRRIYWITYQPMRGLVSCCPEFVLCAAALLLLNHRTRLRPDRLVLIPIVGGYLLFYMTYAGWTGGWSVGPRYLIPMLPILWMLVLEPARRFPLMSGCVIALSIFNLLAVTSVGAVDPIVVENGRPTNNDIVRSNLVPFLHGTVNQAPNTQTLARLIGIPERLQMIPFLLLVLAYFATAFTLRERKFFSTAQPPPL